MVVTAHPDDPEFGAGGTIAKLAKEGREVIYVIATNGSKGTSDRTLTPADLVRIRQAEQRRAARVLGVAQVEFLGYEDGELEDTRQLRLDVTRQIRRWRPGLVITQHPERTYRNFFGWHRDHRITGGAVLDCVYPLARDHLAFPDLWPEYEPYAVREVYLIQWEKPELVVDITATIDLKLEAVLCHASQVADLPTAESRVRPRAAALGQASGLAYAEGFDHIVLRG
jgi:LmbE family N-acetylglucosaminyl deacetylase